MKSAIMEWRRLLSQLRPSIDNIDDDADNVINDAFYHHQSSALRSLSLSLSLALALALSCSYFRGGGWEDDFEPGFLEFDLRLISSWSQLMGLDALNEV